MDVQLIVEISIRFFRGRSEPKTLDAAVCGDSSAKFRADNYCRGRVAYRHLQSQSEVINNENLRWDLILETIRDIPELQQIDLEDLWYDDSDGGFVMPDDMDPEPLYDYLLKRRSDNPWQSMCQARLARYEEEDTDTEKSEDHEDQ